MCFVFATRVRKLKRTNIETISILHNSMTLPLQSAVIRFEKNSCLNFQREKCFKLIKLRQKIKNNYKSFKWGEGRIQAKIATVV